MAKIKPLRSSPIFSDLNDRELAVFSKYVREERYEAETVVVAERMRSDAFFFIDSGRIAFSADRPGSTGEPLVLGPGDTFGEWAILAPGHLTAASAKALEGSDLLALRSQDFERFAREEPAIALKVAGILNQRIWQSLGEVKELLTERL